MKFFIYLYYCLLLFSWSFANAQQEIKIIGSNNSILGTVDYIQENRFYFSLNDFSDILLKKKAQFQVIIVYTILNLESQMMHVYLLKNPNEKFGERIKAFTPLVST